MYTYKPIIRHGLGIRIMMSLGLCLSLFLILLVPPFSLLVLLKMAATVPGLTSVPYVNCMRVMFLYPIVLSKHLEIHCNSTELNRMSTSQQIIVAGVMWCAAWLNLHRFCTPAALVGGHSLPRSTWILKRKLGAVEKGEEEKRTS